MRLPISYYRNESPLNSPLEGDRELYSLRLSREIDVPSKAGRKSIRANILIKINLYTNYYLFNLQTVIASHVHHSTSIKILSKGPLLESFELLYAMSILLYEIDPMLVKNKFCTNQSDIACKC